MISDYRCFFCFADAFERLLEKENLSIEDRNHFTRDMAALYIQKWSSFSAPVFSRELHIALSSYTHNHDPYKEVKKQSNDLVLSIYPELRTKIMLSDNPFDTALRLAIAGNIIDFAICNNYDLHATMNNVMHSDFAINHSAELKKRLAEAGTVLYLGDNAGEIVLDKLFIENIVHPNLFYAVRGAPVINDATLQDAEYVGMNTVAHVISNGYDAPSTIVDKCSEEFKDVFEKADVIISKGQGNLEGLLDAEKKDIFFLLMIKCNVIADALKVKKGDFVVKRMNGRV